MFPPVVYTHLISNEEFGCQFSFPLSHPDPSPGYPFSLNVEKQNSVFGASCEALSQKLTRKYLGMNTGCYVLSRTPRPARAPADDFGCPGKKQRAALAALSSLFCCIPGEAAPGSKLVLSLPPKEEGLLDQGWPPPCWGYILIFVRELALCPLQRSVLLCFIAGQSETTAWLFTASLPKCPLSFPSRQLPACCVFCSWRKLVGSCLYLCKASPGCRGWFAEGRGWRT